MKASAFDNIIIRYNTLFEDTRKQIIKEEGDGYNEYLRSMFRAYLECGNEEFADVIKNERRKWTHGKLGTSYYYHDLMDLGRLTYNNLLDENTWSVKPQAKPRNDEKNYLALATQLMSQMKAIQDGNNGIKAMEVTELKAMEGSSRVVIGRTYLGVMRIPTTRQQKKEEEVP